MSLDGHVVTSSAPAVLSQARLQCFVGDERGSVAIIFALALIPLTLAVGAAVDYSLAARIKAKLDAAADAAALAAVNKSAMGGSAQAAQTAALSLFNAHAAALKGATVDTLSASVGDTALKRTAVVSYKANVATAFMGLVGINAVPIGGSATAASAPPVYIDFHLLLDNTPSMGVGATTADINTLIANTPDKCAFACHDLSTSPNDYYGLAKALGVKMRIDVVRQATQKLMDTASTSQVVPGQFRMAIHTFGPDAKTARLTTLQSLTSNLQAARTAAAGIDLMTVPYQNYASDTLTDFHDVLTDASAAISSPGDGSSSSAPQKILFFVSDGVADRALGSPPCSQPTTNGADSRTGKRYVRCQEPLDVALCTAVKNRRIKIAVLYTTYLPLPTNAWYVSWIAPFSSKIAANMQSCASPGLYFEVSPTQGISDAMTALFQKALQQARLTR